MIDVSKIAFCKIFPPLGVARVGDSKEPDGHYFPPETPDGMPWLAAGGPPDAPFTYRDATGAIRRQAALFHVYAFDAEGKPLGELLAKQAQIRWTVALANKKAAWFEFDGAHGARSAFEGTDPPVNIGGEVLGVRNENVGKMVREAKGPHGHRYVASEDRRKQLEIIAPERSVSGKSKKHQPGKDELQFVGKFQRKHDVYLGEIATDEEGRLIVLGGHGMSAPVDPTGKPFDKPEDAWITHYANNDNWFDDTADGPVKAEVALLDADGKPTKKIEVEGGSWVVVTPPDFAPDTANVVTLYDVMEEVAHDERSLCNPTTPPVHGVDDLDLLRDIWPIIERSAGYRWVTKLGLRGHGQGRPGDGLNGNGVSFKNFVEAMNAQDGALRARMFNALREPIYTRPNGQQPPDLERAQRTATALFMPPLSGDEGGRIPGEPATWLSLTYLQYERMKVWANSGELPVTKAGSILLEDGSLHPSVMTRALLDRCCGGAFFPGIEVTSIVRDPKLYTEAFRFDHAVLEPGDLTKYMACPWQADFYECRDDWWPAQRPDDVVHEDSFKQIFGEFEAEKTGTLAGQFETVLGERQLWARGVGDAGPRPSNRFLMLQVVPEVKDREKFRDYAQRLAKGWRRALAGSASREGGASPWRQRYLLQEACDRFADRFFQPQLPEPETVLDIKAIQAEHVDLVKRFSISSLLDLRQCWRDATRLDSDAVAKSLGAISDQYDTAMQAALFSYLVNCIEDFPLGDGSKIDDRSASAFRKALVDPELSVSSLDEKHRKDIPLGSEIYCKYVLAELRAAMRDVAYMRHTTTNGDNAMVQDWRRLGFVTKRELKLSDGNSLTVHVETERDKYDGRSYRDNFYYLLNIQDHQDFLPQAIRIAESALAYAQKIIDSTAIENADHPESFIAYSQATFRAKLEEIYEIQRARAQNFDIYYSALGINMDSLKQGLVRNAPFNQCDGAWLRNISAAGPGDEVRALLFEVWSDEIGNGNPLLHHGNLYTNLLSSLGIYMHGLTTRAYADDPKIPEASFVSPVFQLAISQHTSRFFPELLGMTLYLEWEVLSLVPGIKLYDYLGLDSHFWQMHVGIDNATNGHGAKARDAVITYLDRMRDTSGNKGVAETWARIWRGFVAFEAIDSFTSLAADASILRRRPPNPAERLAEVMTRKANYGSLNHFRQRLGQHRINDLFDTPPLFQKMLSESKWIVPGDPDQSQFLKHLTTFQGPMYQIFDTADIEVWRAWIEWLGRDGDTPKVKRYFDKAQAMEALLIEMRNVAEGVGAHSRYKAQAPGGKRSSIADLFASNDTRGLMRALAAEGSGWVTPGDPAASPLVADLMRGSNLMGKALDRRFPGINNRTGRQIVIEWVRAGCPITGDTEPVPEDKVAPPLKPLGPDLYMHSLGMGAVH